MIAIANAIVNLYLRKRGEKYGMKTWYNRPAMQDDDFWTHDITLFDGVFSYYHHKPQPVRGKIHLVEEQYFGAASEIVPLKTRKGTCCYILLRPYVYEPILTLTVGLYNKPKPYADQAAAIGETLRGAKQEGVREVEIGNAQAWYYPADHTIVLWEAFFEEFVRDQPLLANPNMRRLWMSIEHWLVKQFPQATRIATPFDDPLFEPEEYQKFLRSLSYEPIAKAAFGKKLT